MHPHAPAPAELLRQADAHLRSLQPAMQARFHHWGRMYRARFEYPGRVLVYCGATGGLLARSAPGRPTKPAKLRGVIHAAQR